MSYVEDMEPPDPAIRRRARNSRVEVKVARGLDDLLMVYAIRAAVYMAEQECPFAEEFDGNDHCATHFIGLHDGEPAGCLRVRFFQQFVKLERLAVRKAYRRSTLAFDLVRYGFEFARRKGFKKVYGHAREGLEPFWARFGGKPIDGRPDFVFSDYAYTEMVADIADEGDAISLNTDPMTILRPEGDWDRPGVLEYSRHRSPRRPLDDNSVAKLREI
jgi:predicted GNAT family N-acyltransferase